jgi:hypothetical protein
MKRALGFLLLAASMLLAQDTLTNDSIVKMTKAGLSESIIVTTIQSGAGKYSTTADDLVKLKQAGVSDKVLAAMLAKASGATTTPVAPVAATLNTGAKGDIPANLDVGVYYKKNGKWEEMLPEVINWKTGGVFKSIASAGIVKGDVNGHVNGAHSRNSSDSPVEVLVVAPEGVAITEYQLVHLHEQSDSREFRTVTGGVMHVSGGATRDLIPFEGNKVANHIYTITLPHLGAGEYGFLPPGAFTSASGAGSLGKLYSFHIVE